MLKVTSTVNYAGLKRGEVFTVLGESDSSYILETEEKDKITKNKGFFIEHVEGQPLKSYEIEFDTDTVVVDRIDCHNLVKTNPFCVKIDNLVLITYMNSIKSISEVKK